jgi:hypothetical protein
MGRATIWISSKKVARSKRRRRVSNKKRITAGTIRAPCCLVRKARAEMPEAAMSEGDRGIGG